MSALTVVDVEVHVIGVGLPDHHETQARLVSEPGARLAQPLQDLRDALAALPEWSEEPLKESFHVAMERHTLKLAELAQPVRVAIVGGAASPGIFETLELLGRERSLKRIDAAIERIGTDAEN